MKCMKKNKQGSGGLSEYKSSDKRLVMVFKDSRERWKKNAAIKQKKLRSLSVKARDLSISRDSWKAKAKELEAENRRLKQEIETLKKTSFLLNSSSIGELKSESANELQVAPRGHVYPLGVVRLAIEQVILSLSSFRGVQKTFELFAQLFNLPIPSYTSIRNWVFKLGLYELKKEKEYRADWIFIVDTTLELGRAKCLVILGINQEKFIQICTQQTRSLEHYDVEVLALEVTECCTGKLVEEKLTKLSSQVGIPKQIVADHGSDIKKGIELYQENHSEVIYTYDVTHQMANLLKSELSENKRYLEFIERCHITRQLIQQTELIFLNPPKPRTKARYHQVNTFVNWAIKILEYENKNDFSLINAEVELDRENLLYLTNKVDTNFMKKLHKFEGKIWENRDFFLEELEKKLGIVSVQKYGEIILQVADKGRKRFQEKLGWVKDYQEDLKNYHQMLTLINLAFKQIKTSGLGRNSAQTFLKQVAPMVLSESSEKLKNKIGEKLETSSCQIPENEIFLGTSDILESILGKYKIFSSRSPAKEVGKMLLTIPLCTIQLTAATVKEAMEKILICDLEDWSVSVIGQSMLSKSRAICTEESNYTKTA